MEIFRWQIINPLLPGELKVAQICDAIWDDGKNCTVWKVKIKEEWKPEKREAKSGKMLNVFFVEKKKLVSVQTSDIIPHAPATLHQYTHVKAKWGNKHQDMLTMEGWIPKRVAKKQVFCWFINYTYSTRISIDKKPRNEKPTV